MAIECAEGLWDGGLSNPVFVAEVYEADGSGRGPVANVTTHGESLIHSFVRSPNQLASRPWLAGLPAGKLVGLSLVSGLCGRWFVRRPNDNDQFGKHGLAPVGKHAADTSLFDGAWEAVNNTRPG